MAEQANSRFADHNMVHCLKCYKAQRNISVHLTKVCMKNNTPEERRTELKKMKFSSRKWIYESRTWDYRFLCKMVTDKSSLQALVDEFLKRGFLVTNMPHASDGVWTYGADGAASPSDTANTSSPDPDGAPSDATEYDGFMHVSRSLRECQKVLQIAKADFLHIFGKLRSKTQISNIEKTTYRYYCEAVLVFGHFQQPGTVEGMTESEWVNRQPTGGRFVIETRQHKTATQQITSFALSQEEEAWFQSYYEKIRPGYLFDYCHLFFISSKGKPVSSVTGDLSRLQESYKLKAATSHGVRRAAGIEADAVFTASQREDVALYMGRSAAAHGRTLAPQAVVATAELLGSLTGSSPERADQTDQDVRSSEKLFSDFIASFPVLSDGQPPTKKQRVDAGFSDSRSFSDKWRVKQSEKRMQYLLSHFPHRKPSVGEVSRLLEKQGWKTNGFTAKKVLQMWDKYCNV